MQISLAYGITTSNICWALSLADLQARKLADSQTCRLANLQTR
jgi:hypothetical protein